MNTTRSPIPARLAVPVRVFAWILLGLIVIPVAFAVFLLIALALSWDDPTSDPHGYAAIFSVLYLLALGAPLIMMVLIVIGLHRNMREAYWGLIVAAVLGAIVLITLTLPQVIVGGSLGFTGVIALPLIALNLTAAFLAFRALRLSPKPSPLPLMPGQMYPQYPGTQYPAQVNPGQVAPQYPDPQHRGQPPVQAPAPASPWAQPTPVQPPPPQPPPPQPPATQIPPIYGPPADGSW